MRRPSSGSGFTLVELLVAVAVMALLGVMAWRGLDAMGRAQHTTRDYSDDVAALQAGLAQWHADLDALMQTAPDDGIDFDGRVLRISRLVPADEGQPEQKVGAASSSGGAIRVVAWGARNVDGKQQWMRWQSAPVRGRAELQAAWDAAALWGQNATEELRRREVAVAAIDNWQVFYFRNDSWSSPWSSATGGRTVAAGSPGLAPDGVRLLLTLSTGQAVSGRITRDWARPVLGPGGS